MCTNFNNDEENSQKAFEYFNPWVKYWLEETNGYVLQESLKFFFLFNTFFSHFLSISIKDFFVERYINFGIFLISFLILQKDKLWKILMYFVCAFFFFFIKFFCCYIIFWIFIFKFYFFLFWFNFMFINIQWLIYI